MSEVRAFDVLAGLVLEDGRTWAEGATEVQLTDARAVLEGEAPYHFVTRARGYSKTMDLAGIALSVLVTAPPSWRLYWLAADVEQGKLALDSITGFVLRTEALADEVELQASRVVAKSGARLEILPADVAGAWGLRPDFIVVDELPQWQETPSAVRLWEAVTSALPKRPHCRLVCITTAGRPSHFAHDVLEHARTSSLWRVSETSGPPPWMPQDRIDEQRSRLPSSVFDQLFQNVWCEAEGSFLDPEALARCFVLPGPTPGRDPHHAWSYFAGLDLGHVNDRSVIAVGHREADHVALDYLETWQGTRSDPVSFAAVEDTVADLHKRFRFRLLADPWQGLHLLERLRARGVNAQVQNFGPALSQRLASTLLQAVNDEALRLYPAPGLKEELLALRLAQTTSGLWKFDHATGGHDDRAVALSLMLVAALEGPRRSPGQRDRIKSGGYSSDRSRLTGERVPRRSRNDIHDR